MRPSQSTPKFVPGEVLIKYRPVVASPASDIAQLKAQQVERQRLVERKFQLRELRHNEVIEVHAYKLPEESDVLAAVAELAKDPSVEFAEPNYYSHLMATPNDTFYSNARSSSGQTYPNSFQRWVFNGSANDRNVNGEAAWDLTTGRADVVIAVVDSGVLLNHPDLQNNIWRNSGEVAANGVDDDGNGFVDDIAGWDFRGNTHSGSSRPDNNPNPDLGDGLDNDDNGDADDSAFHGTFVAGVIAGRGNDGQGIAGVCWNCKIMPLKVFTDDGGASTQDIVNAITYAAQNGANVINLSLGGSVPSQTQQAAINHALSRGVVVIAAAGNDNSASPEYPASFPGVLSVGATHWGGDLALADGTANNLRKRAPYSQFGTQAVDVVAPGTVVSTSFYTRADELGGDGQAGAPFVNLSQGTSFSAPLVAGMAGLMISHARNRNVTLTGARVVEIIETTAVDLPDDPTDSPNAGANWDNHGRVDLLAALNAVANGNSPPPAGTEELKADDDTAEQFAGGPGAYLLNRLTPSAFPATLRKIRVYFDLRTGAPNSSGSQLRLLAFVGPAGQTPNRPNFTFDQVRTIPTIPANGDFLDFDITNGPTVNPGQDLYVGIQTPTTPLAIFGDANGTQQNRSYFSADAQSFAPLVFVSQQGVRTPVNLMVRAIVEGGSGSCSYAIAPSGRSHNASGEAGIVNVTTNSGCSWTARSNVNWISIVLGANGSGNGSVSYSLQANTGSSSRTGTLTIAGQTFTVNQAGTSPGGTVALRADYQFQNTLTSSTAGAPALTNLGNNTFRSATVDGRTRTVLSFAENDGVALSPVATLTANGAYSVVILFAMTNVDGYRRVLDFKSGASDNGLYVIDGDLDLYPYGAPPIDLFWYEAPISPVASAKKQAPPIAENTFVQVVLTRDANQEVMLYVDGQPYSSVTDDLDITSIEGDTLRFFRDNDSGGVTDEASAGSVARIRVYAGALSTSEVAALDRLPTGQTCTYSISPENRSAPASGGTNTVSVTAATGCNWTATANDNWLSVTPTTGSGNGQVSYTVQPNTSATSRTGTLTIATKTFTVNQTGATSNNPTISVQPTSLDFQSVNVGATNDLTLTVRNTGNATLNVTGITSSNSRFSVTSGTNFNVAAGGQQTVTVRFSPTASGMQTGTLTIASNASNGPTTTVQLRGEGAQPQPSCPNVSNSISPSSGPVGTVVTITGQNFTGVTAVRFTGGATATPAINSQGTQIQATVPNNAQPGVVNLVKQGCQDTPAGSFQITQAGNCVAVSISQSLAGAAGTTVNVPIMVGDLTGKNVISYDFSLSYDSAVLRPASSLTDRTGTLSAGDEASVLANIVGGRVVVTGFRTGVTPFTGAGVLVNVRFDVIGGAQACGNLEFANFGFNGGAVCSTPSSGRLCVGGSAIAGTVTYCSDSPVAVSGVSLTATGASTVMAMTDNAGAYRLSNLTGGPYTVTPSKTGDVLGSDGRPRGINGFDAARVAQHAVDLNPLNGCQLVAGDANGDGQVNGFDAALIAQFAVGLNNPQGQVGTWKFSPDKRTYNTVSGEQTGQNFTAVLVGDVNGDWRPQAGNLIGPEITNLASLSRVGQPALPAWLPNVKAAPGQSLFVPVAVGDLTGLNVTSFDLDLFYDPQALQLRAPAVLTKGTLSDGMTVVVNDAVPGRLRISAFGVAALAGSGDLFRLNFVARKTTDNAPLLFWNEFQLNDGTPRIELSRAEGTVKNVSALNYRDVELAGGAFVAAFGQNLSFTAAEAEGAPAEWLAGVSVMLRDSAGVEWRAPVLFVSPSQVNYQIPPGVANGVASVTFVRDGVAAGRGMLQIISGKSHEFDTPSLHETSSRTKPEEK